MQKIISNILVFFLIILLKINFIKIITNKIIKYQKIQILIFFKI